MDTIVYEVQLTAGPKRYFTDEKHMRQVVDREVSERLEKGLPLNLQVSVLRMALEEFLGAVNDPRRAE